MPKAVRTPAAAKAAVPKTFTDGQEILRQQQEQLDVMLRQYQVKQVRNEDSALREKRILRDEKIE